MMPTLQRLREYAEAANVARQRAHSEQKAQAKEILQEIERSYRRLIEIERWAADQQQYNRPFAHFGLFNGHAAPTSLPNDIVSRSLDQQHGNVSRTLSDPTGPPKRLRRAGTPPRAGGEGSSLGSI